MKFFAQMQSDLAGPVDLSGFVEVEAESHQDAGLRFFCHRKRPPGRYQVIVAKDKDPKHSNGMPMCIHAFEIVHPA